MARYLRLGIFLFILSIWLIACGADTAPQIVPNDTLTPTLTVPPSITPAPVVGNLPTSTPVPEATRDINLEVTAGPSPTSPLRPTFTPMPPTETNTPLAPTATPDIAIEYFRSNSLTIEPNGNVTLSWSVVGADDVTIYRLSENGLRERNWPVGLSGSITVSSNSNASARFELEAEAGTISESRLLVLSVGCNEIWFFAPAPSGCPLTSVTESLHVEQIFEGGRMIWMQSGGNIFVIFNDGSQPRWQQYIDQYNSSQPENDPSFVPPSPELQQPVRGFGLIWRNQTDLRDRLGWATTPEIAYDGALQEGVDATYIRSQQDGILQLDSGGRSWSIVAGTTFVDTRPPTPTPSAVPE